MIIFFVFDNSADRKTVRTICSNCDFRFESYITNRLEAFAALKFIHFRCKDALGRCNVGKKESVRVRYANNRTLINKFGSDCELLFTKRNQFLVIQRDIFILPAFRAGIGDHKLHRSEGKKIAQIKA